MDIAVVGLGYVGLVTSACLARMGHRVVGVEASPERLRALRQCEVPFYEPGLSDLVNEEVRTGRLSFASSLEVAESVGAAEAVVIAVGTHDGNGRWQTGTISMALEAIVPSLSDGVPVVIRSTLPPRVPGRRCDVR